MWVTGIPSLSCRVRMPRSKKRSPTCSRNSSAKSPRQTAVSASVAATLVAQDGRPWTLSAFFQTIDRTALSSSSLKKLPDERDGESREVRKKLA